jgi:hypothetical protein
VVEDSSEGHALRVRCRSCHHERVSGAQSARDPAVQEAIRSLAADLKVEALEEDRADLLAQARARAPDCLSVLLALYKCARWEDVPPFFPALWGQKRQLVADETCEQIAVIEPEHREPGGGKRPLSRSTIGRRIAKLHQLAFLRRLVIGCSFKGRGWASKYELPPSRVHRRRWRAWRRRDPDRFDPTLRRRKRAESARAEGKKAERAKQALTGGDVLRSSRIRDPEKENRASNRRVGKKAERAPPAVLTLLVGRGGYVSVRLYVSCTKRSRRLEIQNCAPLLTQRQPSSHLPARREMISALGATFGRAPAGDHAPHPENASWGSPCILARTGESLWG